MTDSKDYLISLLKDKYDYEMTRKNSFETSLNIPITLLTVLFAGVYIVSVDVTTTSSICIINSLKWLLIALLFISSTITMVFLFKVYFGYKRSYCTFPESNVVYNQDYKDLEHYAKEHFADSYEDSLTIELKNRVIKWYLDCNNHNTPVNDKRSDALFYARLFVCIALSIGLALLIVVTIIKSF